MEELKARSRLDLARLAREYMLAAQFNSRTGYAALRINHGEETYKDTAIANWMAASPVYTRRMQRAMGFAGQRDVAAIFKGLQLECGFSHQYFDVHFAVSDAENGRFWLNSCGALLEAEPRGDEAVRVMCHDIEDPTFDATATATNPRARMRPIHRPPRVPATRKPHCEWQVFIDHAAPPLADPPLSLRMADTELARLQIPRQRSAEQGGLDDYSGPLFEQLHLEQFSHAALCTICAELAVQFHLLINSLLMIITDTFGADAARKVAAFQMEGTSRVVSERLCRQLPPGCQGIDAVVAVLAVHPAFQPREYWCMEVVKLDSERALIRFDDSPAAREVQPGGWHALLARGEDAGLASLVRGVEPRAVIKAVSGQPLCWEIQLQEAPCDAEDSLAVQVARGTVLYQTELEDHIPLLQL